MYKENERPKVLETMLQKGVHFGHKKSKWNPKMAPYVYGVRNNTYIIDLNKTFDLLNGALDRLIELKKEEKTIMFVGLKTQTKHIVTDLTEKIDMPYVVNRWVGGTLTNFKEISKRLTYFRDMEAKKASGELDKYTKRERVKIDKELEVLERKWGGIKKLEKLPDAIFMIDSSDRSAVIREAKEAGLEVFAIVDTNTDPEMIDHPIPANDDSISSLQYLADEIANALKKK